MEISLENLVVDIGAESVNTNKLKIHYLTTYHNNALHVISAHIVLCISKYSHLYLSSLQAVIVFLQYSSLVLFFQHKRQW